MEYQCSWCFEGNDSLETVCCTNRSEGCRIGSSEGVGGRDIEHRAAGDVAVIEQALLAGGDLSQPGVEQYHVAGHIIVPIGTDQSERTFAILHWLLSWRTRRCGVSTIVQDSSDPPRDWRLGRGDLAERTGFEPAYVLLERQATLPICPPLQVVIPILPVMSV